MDDDDDEYLGQRHLDILNHPVTDVLAMLSAMLQRIIETNDGLRRSRHHHSSHAPAAAQAPAPEQHDHDDSGSSQSVSSILSFHGRNIPAITLQAYLMRILKYCPATNEVFLSLIVYFDRIAKHAAPPATQRLQGPTADPYTIVPHSDVFVMDSYNVHRLVIAGVTVASKFFSDVFYKNSRYAKVGGLPLEELNHLELQFLLLCDFRLAITLEELQSYADLLLQFWDEQHQMHLYRPDASGQPPPGAF
ncbi:cyclin-domain-containing protein [Dipodascopsis tothii]|uniref:cyclin-domain-containing protein n=1 Tax=Dipodascopsis tothii TaxID=44089 RepID=UPI0034CD6A4B